jgi:hypothetical protein
MTLSWPSICNGKRVHVETNALSLSSIQVRVYGVESNGTTAPKAMYSHEGPVLDVTWSKVSIAQPFVIMRKV